MSLEDFLPDVLVDSDEPKPADTGELEHSGKCLHYSEMHGMADGVRSRANESGQTSDFYPM